MKAIKKLIRIHQWYKNTIIFLAIIFAPEFISYENISLLILGFIALCLISSANYIRNDLVDKESDRLHPEKKNRPIAAGLISVRDANVLWIVFATAGFLIAFFLDITFGILGIMLFVITEIYSRWLKNIVLVDVFTIGVNFIIRAVSGIILIDSFISPWIIMGVFFVALFLAFMKRKSEIESLDDVRELHRKALKQYNSASLNSMVLISAMLVIITYSFYSLTGPHNDWRLVLTVPFVVFVILRQIHLSSINDRLVQMNTNMLKDKHTIVTMIIYFIITILLIYYIPADYFVKI